MADKKKPKGGQKKSGDDRHIEPRESFHLSQELLDALLAYVADARPATSKSATIRLALEELLEREGYWPPKAGDEG